MKLTELIKKYLRHKFFVVKLPMVMLIQINLHITFKNDFYISN